MQQLPPELQAAIVNFLKGRVSEDELQVAAVVADDAKVEDAR